MTIVQQPLQTCNGYIFRYGTNDADAHSVFLNIYIGLTGLLLIFLLYKMFRLCSKAFSYSNFHIHQTYKLYALCIVSCVIMMLARYNQNQLNLQLKQLEHQQGQQIYPPLKAQLKGFQFINDIFGMLSIITNNYLHMFNAFTWLMIALSCDFSLNRGQSIQNNKSNSRSNNQKQNIRVFIRYLQAFLIYCLFPCISIISIFGTLNHKKNDAWCGIVLGAIILSSIIPLLVFGVALYNFSSRFWDPQIPKITKIGLVYIMITTTIRALYFLVLAIKSDGDVSFGGDILNLFYVVFCTLIPIVVMSILSEKQLKNEQYTRNVQYIQFYVDHQQILRVH